MLQFFLFPVTILPLWLAGLFFMFRYVFRQKYSLVELGLNPWYRVMSPKHAGLWFLWVVGSFLSLVYLWMEMIAWFPES